MWPGTRPTATPSFILVHPTAWPQYTNVTDRTGQRSDSIRRFPTVAQKFFQNRLSNKFVTNAMVKRQAISKTHYCTNARFVMAGLCNRAGHYIYALWFLSIYLSFVFSWPNLSGHKLDVYHTSTHGVALVRI